MFRILKRLREFNKKYIEISGRLLSIESNQRKLTRDASERYERFIDAEDEIVDLEEAVLELEKEVAELQEINITQKKIASNNARMGEALQKYLGVKFVEETENISRGIGVYKAVKAKKKK